MKDKLIEILESMGYEQGKTIFQQGSFGKDMTYPESMFTFFNVETPDSGFYDNEATKAHWTFYLYFYSSDPLKLNTELKRATQLLKQNGWIIGSRNGNDINSDVETHKGRYTTIYYIEQG